MASQLSEVVRRKSCQEGAEDRGEQVDNGQLAEANRVKMGAPQAGASSSKGQFSSFLLFASLIVLINLCPPFQLDFGQQEPTAAQFNYHQPTSQQQQEQQFQLPSQQQCLNYFKTGLQFVRLMFRNPMRMEARATRYTLAEARVLGKMAKVWYIKKKIKKLSKKLKKHTIAVPVFTAIPIYEHSYYPQPHVTHVSHGGGGMHHAAAASSYAPTVTQVTSGAGSGAGTLAAAAAAAAAQQQMTAAASSQHPAAYRMAPPSAAGHHGHHHAYHPHASGSHHIINAYAPSQPLYVDDAGGLYGHYGNAYGRYDGGYHIW